MTGGQDVSMEIADEEREGSRVPTPPERENCPGPTLLIFLGFYHHPTIFFFGRAHSTQKFLGQGSTPCHTSNQSHGSDKAGPLTCCTTRERLTIYFYTTESALTPAIPRGRAPWTQATSAPEPAVFQAVRSSSARTLIN